MVEDGGNFKGVMLCDRPADGRAMAKAQPLGGTWFPASGNADGFVGLPPAQKAPLPLREKGKATAMDKHKKYLAELKKAQREEAQRGTISQLVEHDKFQKVTEFNSQLRAAILEGQDVTAWRPAAKATAVKQKQEFDELERQALSTLNDTATSKGTTVGKGDAGLNSTTSKSAMGLENTFRKLAKVDEPDAAAMSSVEKEMEDLINEALAARQGDGADVAEAAAPAAPAEPEEKQGPISVGSKVADAAKDRPMSATKTKAKKSSGSKPAWALTQEAADEIEEEEEEELLSFVDSLDYDNYIETIDDPEVKVMMEELRKGEGVMTDVEERQWKKDFVTVLNHLALRDAKGATFEQKAMSLAGMSDGGESHVSRMTESMMRKMEAAQEQRSAIESGILKRKEEGAWDASTNAGDDTARFEKVEKSKEADDFLMENPDMKGVHSIHSARQLLDSASKDTKKVVPEASS